MRRLALRIGLATLAAVFTLPRHGLTYPIAPATLWELTERSERIVLARVQAVEESRLDDGRRDVEPKNDVAVLRVLETWKGSPALEVRVSFIAQMICPAPPRYVKGEVVLAFLQSGESLLEEYDDLAPKERDGLARRWKGRWFTVSLSYGTLYPTSDDVPVFRRLVTEALEMQAEGPVPTERRREWLLSAAEQRATRWHGLYELFPKGDEMHAFYDLPERRDAAVPLSVTELQRIAAGFVRDPSFDEAFPLTLALLADHVDPALDAVSVGVLEKLLTADRVPYEAIDALPRLLARFGDPDPKGRFGAKAEEPWKLDGPALRRLWRKARRELSIPDAAPVTDPPRRVRGVGGDTPS